MNQLADKVVAYRLPDEGDEEMFGLCIRREGDLLRVMVLQKDDNRDAPLTSVLRKLSDEDGIVNSLEERLGSLQAKLAKERGAAAQSKNYRIQETMLQWATRRLEGVDAAEWRRLAQERHPSAVVKAVGCAAASIAADAKLVSSTWTDAQKLFGQGKDMAVSLRHAGEQRMNTTLYNSLEENYISDSSLSYAFVAQESPSLSILHKWVTALVDYQRARYMEDGEAELQQQLSGCQNSLQSAKDRRGSLMEQVELINSGSCYIRTQTVRSVPIDRVLYLMTAEKVTTRQYLLREMAPLEALDEIVSRPLASARSARGSRQEDNFDWGGFQSARTVNSARAGGNRTNAGVEIPPIHIPKVDSARAGAWVGTRGVRPQQSSGVESDGNATSSHSRSDGASPAAAPKVSPRHALAAPKAETAESGAATPGSTRIALSSGAAAAAPSPASLSARADGRRERSEPASQGRALAHMHGGTEPMQVLTDVRNNFQNVQTVLLACLEDYQTLEDKYANTVDHSKQLLLTLESRDEAIARLQRELAVATAALADVNKSTPVQRNGHANVSVGQRGGKRHPSTGSPATSCAPLSDAFDGDAAFRLRFEQMLQDTLEFLQGAAATPSVFESEVNAA